MLTLFAMSAASAGPIDTQGIELLWCQDLSKSAEDVEMNIGDMFRDTVQLLAERTDNAKIALSSFVDKPKGEFGYEGDWCYKEHLPFSDIAIANGAAALVDNDAVRRIRDEVDFWYTGSGRDWEENQLGALVHGIQSNGVWDRNPNPAKTRVVVVATSSGYHTFNDDWGTNGLKRSELGWEAYAAPVQEWCLNEAYPSLTDVHEAIREYGVNVVFLVPDYLVDYYQKLVAGIGADRAFVVPVEIGYQNFVSSLQIGLDSVDKSFADAANLEVRRNIIRESKLIHAQKEDSHSPQGKFEFSSSSLRLRTDANSLDLTNVEVCGDSVVELMIVQDASSGFKGMMDRIADSVEDAMFSIIPTLPGSRVGVASFTDKPISKFGFGGDSANDYCWIVQEGLSSSSSQVRHALSNIVVRSGNDEPEAQLHAMLAPYLSSMGDFTKTARNEDGKRVVRIVALVTDSPYHESGDASWLPRFDLHAGGYHCDEVDYPTISDVRNGLIDGMMFPMIITNQDQEKLYQDLVNERLGLNGHVGVVEFEDTQQMQQQLTEQIIEGVARSCTFRGMTKRKSLTLPQSAFRVDLNLEEDSDTL